VSASPQLGKRQEDREWAARLLADQTIPAWIDAAAVI
jgi:hypothetical protein